MGTIVYFESRVPMDWEMHNLQIIMLTGEDWDPLNVEFGNGHSREQVEHLAAQNSRNACAQNIGHFHYFLSEMYNNDFFLLSQFSFPLALFSVLLWGSPSSANETLVSAKTLVRPLSTLDHR
jgi:hypothetical protein